MTTHFLVFQLYGSFASWGDIAVGEVRPTLPVPTKSSILGLLAAAKGITRQDDNAHLSLSESLSLGIQVITRGNFLSDYQTIQTPLQTNIKKKFPHTRKEELESGDLGTILSTRTYWTTPLYKVAFYGEKTNLEEYCLSLKSPKFTLYLGRKSCTLDLPMNPHIITAKTFEEALNIYPVDPIVENRLKKEHNEYWWEVSCPSSLKISKTVTLRTNPRSRIKWQFSELQMHTCQQKED